jgi:GNAT superfamily N-acetyltransferase
MLSADLTVRAATLADIAAAVALFNRCSRAIIGTPEYTVDEIHGLWQTPGFDLAQSTRVITTVSNDLIGYVAVWDLASRPVQIIVYGRVDPAWEGRGLGTYLMQWAEARARRALDHVPPEFRVVIRALIPSAHTAAAQLFHQQGMHVARHFWRMVIDLNQPPAEIIWPEGITLRRVADYHDLHAIYRAERDIFRDHWGWTDQPDEEQQYTRWHYRWQQADPNLWLLAC